MNTNYVCVCVAITCIPIFIGASLLSPSFIPKQVLSSLQGTMKVRIPPNAMAR